VLFPSVAEELLSIRVSQLSSRFVLLGHALSSSYSPFITDELSSCDGKRDITDCIHILLESRSGSHTSPFIRSMRRRYGIPDHDQRPFNVAYAAARLSQEDKRKIQDRMRNVPTSEHTNGVSNGEARIGVLSSS
jgi:hypothetical protein